MADEAVAVEGPYNIQDWNVLDGASISGGTLMSGSNLARTGGKNTGGVDSGAHGMFAGIASTDKVAGDGSTTLGLHQTGVFDLTTADDGAVTIGQQVVMSGANHICAAAAADLLTGAVVGTALEDIAENTAGEVDIGRRG